MRALMSVRLACRLGDWRQLRMWVHGVSTACIQTQYMHKIHDMLAVNNDSGLTFWLCLSCRCMQ